MRSRYPIELVVMDLCHLKALMMTTHHSSGGKDNWCRISIGVAPVAMKKAATSTI